MATSFVLLSLRLTFPPSCFRVWMCVWIVVRFIDRNSQHVPQHSFPPPLSKYCPGNFVILSKAEMPLGLFSPLFVSCLPRLAGALFTFLERSRWSSALFTGGSEPKWDWIRLSSSCESSSSSLDSSSRKLQRRWVSFPIVWTPLLRWSRPRGQLCCSGELLRDWVMVSATAVETSQGDQRFHRRPILLAESSGWSCVFWGDHKNAVFVQW